METTLRTAISAPGRSARLAGLLYLIVIVAGVFGELVVRTRIMVSGDVAATARNMLANEQLVRWGFAVEVFACVCVVPLIALLYELLKIVNGRVALLAVFFSLVGLGIQGASLAGHLAPLILLKRSEVGTVFPELLRAQIDLALQLQSIGYAIALAFFGGTMLARGFLIVRSWFFPRVIGVLLVVQGIAYLVNTMTGIVAPHLAGTVFRLLMITALGEIGLCLWLLIMGVNDRRWFEQLGAKATT